MRPEQLQEGVLCRLKCGRWDASVKMDKVKLKKALPEDIIRARQDLLDDRTLLKDIATVRRTTKGLLERNSLPFPIEGLFWVNKNRIEYLDKEFKRLKDISDERVEKFIVEYNNLKEQFKKKYPGYWRPDKYPTEEKLREKFYFEWQFLQISAPDQSVLSPELYKRETEKLKNMVKEIEEMTVNMVGNMLLKRINTLHKQFESGSVNAGTVNSFERFFGKWDSLWKDHVDQKNLRMVISRLRKEIKGVELEDLKENEKMQAQIGKSLEKAVENIKSIPNFQLKRKLDI
jgi:hypothetical protein